MYRLESSKALSLARQARKDVQLISRSYDFFDYCPIPQQSSLIFKSTNRWMQHAGLNNQNAEYGLVVDSGLGKIDPGISCMYQDGYRHVKSCAKRLTTDVEKSRFPPYTLEMYV
jgi:hypothetical protein